MISDKSDTIFFFAKKSHPFSHYYVVFGIIMTESFRKERGFSVRKKRSETNKTSLRETLSRSLALPEDILLDLPRITLSGNRELEIENYKNVLEYLDTAVCLNCKEGIIKILGSELCILSVTDEAVRIRGDIKELIFQK